MNKQTLELAHSIIANHDCCPRDTTFEVWQDMQELAQAVVDFGDWYTEQNSKIMYSELLLKSSEQENEDLRATIGVLIDQVHKWKELAEKYKDEDPLEHFKRLLYGDVPK